jgi:hypothetical protein
MAPSTIVHVADVTRSSREMSRYPLPAQTDQEKRQG